MASAGAAANKLDQLVHNLPRELFDHIFDLAFDAPAHFTPVTKDYTPPVQLAVTRSTRLRFAKTYFGNGTFRFHDPDLLCKWLIALPAEHQALLAEAKQLVLCVHISTAAIRPPLPDAAVGKMAVQVAEIILYSGVRNGSVLVVSRPAAKGPVGDRCFLITLTGETWPYRVDTESAPRLAYDGPACGKVEHAEAKAVGRLI